MTDYYQTRTVVYTSDDTDWSADKTPVSEIRLVNLNTIGLNFNGELSP